MIIAHLPAGYLLTRLLKKKWYKAPAWPGLMGSVIPDIDIIYFYGLSNRTTHHREYWTHIPSFWVGVALFAYLAAWWKGGKKLLHSCHLFFAGVLLHLCLDAPMAPIYWFRPFSSKGYQWLTLNIHAIYDFWVWNFILHPFFLIEIAICVLALVVWRLESYQRKQLSFAL